MPGSFLLYAEHFGLRDRAFSLLPDPEYIYWSEGHARAFAMLEYGLLTRAPVTVITGEIGAGKTTLVRELLRRLPDEFAVALVSNAHGDRGQLLHWILLALGQNVDANASYVHLFTQLQDFVIGQYSAGKSTLLIFDEAQNLPVETLEELRLLTNINADKDELLQIVLVGQPQLREKVNRPELEQFAQRIASDFHLAAMSADDVDKYVSFRLQVAGASREIFTPAAKRAVHHFSRGIPRLINKICENALVYAYGEGLADVDQDIVNHVVADWKRLGHTDFQVASDRRKQLGPEALKAKIEALHCSGMPAEDIQKRLMNRNGQQVPAQRIGAVVSALRKGTRQWQTMPLPRSLAAVFFDETWVRIRLNGRIETRAVLVVSAHDTNGHNRLIAAGVGDSEHDDYHSSIMTDLRQRGFKSPSLISVEGSDACFVEVAKAFPTAIALRSVGQTIRSVFNVVKSHERKEAFADISSILSTGSELEVREHLSKLHGAVSSKGRLVLRLPAPDWRGLAKLLQHRDLARQLVAAASGLSGIAKQLDKVLNATVSYPSAEAVMQRLFLATRKIASDD